MSSPAPLPERGGSRNPESSPRRPFDFHAIAEVFAAQGFHEASMNEIARRAKVAKPTIYRYFASKEELCDATVDAVCEDLLQHLFAAYDRAEGLPLRELIEVAIAAYLDYARERPAALRLLLDSGIPRSSAAAQRVDETFAAITARVGELFRTELADRGIASTVGADVLATVTVASAQQVGRELTERPEWDPDAVLDLVTELWSNALANLSRRSLSRVDRAAARRG
ncbi:MAG: TetR/AcrR family transcriptional regulator [Baekduiaceae bacterium]